jgi:hypothetical protein
MCQPDERLSSYVSVTKHIYKALASVRKIPLSHELEIYSPVYFIGGPQETSPLSKSIDELNFFPKKSPFNACFLAIDPKKHSIQCWYVPYVPFW